VHGAAHERLGVLGLVTGDIFTFFVDMLMAGVVLYGSYFGGRFNGRGFFAGGSRERRRNALYGFVAGAGLGGVAGYGVGSLGGSWNMVRHPFFDWLGTPDKTVNYPAGGAGAARRRGVRRRGIAFAHECPGEGVVALAV
jgi:hypothetical protein